MRTIRRTFGLVAVTGLAGALAIMLNALPAVAGGPTALAVPSGGFPIKISKSGSYIMDSNLKVTNGARGIVINASNVTVDFNGFTLFATTSAAKPGVDSTVTANITNVVIKNGMVNNFGGDGILLGANSFVKDMTVTNNKGFGLDFTDNSSGYSHNIINGNTNTVNNGTQLGNNLCNLSTTCP